MKKIVTLLVCLFVCTTPNVASTMETSDADIQFLVDDLGSRVKVVDRSFDTYHYTSAPNIGDVSSAASSDFQKYISRSSEAYFDASLRSSTSDSGVPGLYVAVDPVVTRNFGGRDWALTRISLPKELKYLDISCHFCKSEAECPDLASQIAICPDIIAPEIQKRLESLGCKTSNYAQMLENSASPVCDQIGIRAVKSLKVSAIKYRYRAMEIDDCIDVESMDRSAFILLPGSWLKTAEIRLFTKNTKDISPEDHERSYLENLFPTWATDSLWAELKAEPNSDFNRWKSEKILNCQMLKKGLE